MLATTQVSSDEILRKNGRSFNFARMFLTKIQGQRAARLYAFCRYVDDLADEASDPRHAKLVLDQVKSQLAGKQAPSDRVADFLNLARETNIDLDVAVALIDGVASDLETVAFETVSDLLRYAYKVAGTVGLMMCSVLDVDDPRAAPFAIDLGVAMQLTNIARDIQEDAENGRRYVPGKWLAGACANDIANPNPRLMLGLQAAAERLVQLAEIYYESAYDGLGFLPSRSRFAILIAARVYRQIGIKLKRQNFTVWRGRTVVSMAEKLAVASAAGTTYLTQSRFHRRTQDHDADLHISLQGLAGAHAVTR
ncbi:MAG: phytoene/squalene synthase family protein [Pseudomonadota bacterium]